MLHSEEPTLHDAAYEVTKFRSGKYSRLICRRGPLLVINRSLQFPPQIPAPSTAIMPSPAVKALKELFPAEQLALAGTEEYEKLNSSYLSSLESEIAPAAIFLPKTADDVGKFITTIKDFALDGSAQFAGNRFPRTPIQL